MAKSADLETTESGKSSYKVQPAPISYSKGCSVSPTNPGNVGVATSKQGPGGK